MNDSTASSSYPLEPDGAGFRAMVDAAVTHLAPFIDGLQQPPYWTWTDDEGARAESFEALREPLPTSGAGLDDSLRVLFDQAYPHSFNCASPGFVAYIPGGGLPAAAVAQLVAAVVNAYPTVWTAGPAVAQIELTVIRWLAQIMGFPANAHGYLASGGSVSGFSALITARRKLLPENFLSGTIYTSEQTHFWIRKAALMAGFPDRAVRSVPVDDRQRMRVDALAEMMAADHREGLHPFFVSGTAGTVHTGAVDDMAAIADCCDAHRERHGHPVWMHVDAAYGGFFMLTERGRRELTGIERADSITLDPHKGLFLPYGVGGLLVKDRDALRRAHSTGGGIYIPDMQDDDERFDATDVSPELSRGFRALQVWLPIRLYGIAAFAEQLEEKLDLTDRVVAALREMPGIELVDPDPPLSMVAFHTGDNERTRQLIDRVLARGRLHMSGTWLGDRFVSRICILSFRTHAEHIEAGLADIREELAALRD